MRLSLISFLLWLLWPASLVAEQRAVVVELFTSQGCSSCPRAEAVMPDLVARDDVIALSLHVDYWDYIGWADPFADPAHAERQRGYARVAGRRMVHTPQMIVNGVAHVAGADVSVLARAMDAARAAPQAVSLELTRDDGGLRIRARATEARGVAGGPFDVHLLRYAPKRAAHVTRGENAGRTMVSHNVVEDWARLGRWDGQGVLETVAPLEGDRPAVVLIQAPGPGRILAAAVLVPEGDG
ncbi:MAG TPA: DUF1223 domain-containing protein [Rhodobacteraceae bacterium]|nr:DUF1223 domain-containing protein [Paracoccaceae bacterium]